MRDLYPDIQLATTELPNLLTPTPGAPYHFLFNSDVNIIYLPF